MTEPPFCAQTFQKHAKKFVHLLDELRKHSAYNANNQAVRISLRNPVFPREFLTGVRKGRRSAHDGLHIETILPTLQETLVELHRLHQKSSGGVDLKDWESNSIAIFYPANKISARLELGTSGTIISPLAEAGPKLATHAVLPLHQSTRTFHISPEHSSGVTCILKAPTPTLALLRMMVLSDILASKWNNPKILELLDGKTLIEDLKATYKL